MDLKRHAQRRRGSFLPYNSSLIESDEPARQQGLRMSEPYVKVAQLKTPEAFRDRLHQLGVELPVDDSILSAAGHSPLAQPIQIGTATVGNRWCIHPMEGWDANRDGSPSALTLRRWRHFGHSGAKLIWGGEAAAVQRGGRANPNQMLATAHNREGLSQLLAALTSAHLASFGSTDDLLVGLQLTHSGRFCRPNSKQLEPHIAYHHPLLDEKFGIAPDDGSVEMTDGEVERLIDDYVAAAGLARDVGFRFVDIKACHGYLLHEFLSARPRAGKFGGDFEGRTRLLATIIGRVRDQFPDLLVLVRLSVFDMPPYQTSREIGQPMDYSGLLPYELGFGVDRHKPLDCDLDEPLRLLGLLEELQVRITIRTFSDRQSFHPAMVTSRPKIHWWASRGKSTLLASASRPFPACRWWAVHIRICRTICRMLRRRSFARDGSTWLDWVGWFCRILSCQRTR